MQRRELQRLLLSRRRFLQHAARVSGAALSAVPLIGCGADPKSSVSDVGPSDASADTSSDAQPPDTQPDTSRDADVSPWFRFAVVADTHIIDEWYTGPESNALDSESMFHTAERYSLARDFLMSLDPAPEFICHVGDFIHDYPSLDLDFFFENETRLDHAIAITNGFDRPFHMCLGNHDYEFGSVPRTETHALFREKLGHEPYHAFVHRGWKFIFLDTYLGDTHDPSSPLYRQGENGSLGEEQLLWLEAELASGEPTFVFLHQMLPIMQRTEVQDLDIHVLLERHKDHVKHVIAGHTHRWLDLGTPWGTPHMVMGATRYDEDCFVVCDVNTETGEYRFANQDSWVNLQPFAETWDPEA